MGCEKLNDKNIFEEFELVFPMLAKKTIDWYNLNDVEIVSILSNGTKVCYSSINRSIRNAYTKKLYKDKTEDEQAWCFEFAHRLNSMMYIKGYNQTVLAKDSDITQATISYYLTGKRLPSIYIVTRIAKTLDCSISYLTDF